MYLADPSTSLRFLPKKTANGGGINLDIIFLVLVDQLIAFLSPFRFFSSPFIFVNSLVCKYSMCRGIRKGHERDIYSISDNTQLQQYTLIAGAIF